MDPVERYSNKDVQRLTGFDARQIIYLSERGIIDSDLEKAGGRGTTRWYSKKAIFGFLVAKTLRKLGLEWPPLKAIVTIVSSFYDELLPMITDSKVKSIPTVFHLVDGKYGYLSTPDGSRTTKVFNVAPDGSVKPSEFSVGELHQRADGEIVVYLERRLELLRGE